MNNSKMACEEGDFETERSGIKKLRKTLVYTAKSKKVALVVAWSLEIGHCAFGHIEQYHDLLQ